MLSALLSSCAAAIVEKTGEAPPPPPPVDVTITKEVVGDEAPADATFTFRLECFGPDFDFSIGAGESFTATMPSNTLCSLTETDNGGAESVSGEFSGVLFDGNQSLTVTNTFPVVPEVLGTAITKTLAAAAPRRLARACASTSTSRSTAGRCATSN